jgi:hypothetical protein
MMICTSLAHSNRFWLKCVQILVNKSLTQTNISSCPQNIYMMSRTSGILQSHSLSLHLSITMKLCEVSWGSSPSIYFSPFVGLQLCSWFISIQDASHKCQSWLFRNYAQDQMTVKTKDWRTFFVLGKFLVRMSRDTSVTLLFVTIFHQFLQTNVETVSRSGPRHLPSPSFPIYEYHPNHPETQHNSCS